MKKKNLIMTMALVGMVGLMVTGCGNKPSEVTVDVQTEQEAVVEETTEEATGVVEEATEVEPETTETEATENDTVDITLKEDGETVAEEQVVVGDYLSEHGITITPQGKMTMQVTDNDTKDISTLHDRDVEVSIETVSSDEEGYSDTIFKAVWVTTQDASFRATYDIFDRYTGYQLSVPNEDVVIQDSGSHTDKTIIEVDDKQYDCSYTFNQDASNIATHAVVTITVHHPSDYDGVVFAAGRNTLEKDAFQETLDLNTAYKLADYPELMDGMYYFTATNN